MEVSLNWEFRHSDLVEISVPAIIDSAFIHSFVEEYRLLRLTFLEDGKGKTVRFLFGITQEATKEDFDIVFISYLVLFKMDYPGVSIELHFPDLTNGKENKAFFQLAQHRLHLLINGQADYYTIYSGGAVFTGNLDTSHSYLPPLVINDFTIDLLFRRKSPADNYMVKIKELLKIGSIKYADIKSRKQVLSIFHNAYRRIRGNIRKWNTADLSGLYFIRTIYDLYMLRYFLYGRKGPKSNYRIGSYIVSGTEDGESANVFRERVMQVLTENQVFYFNDIEAYFFSILVQNSTLFKLPESESEAKAILANFLTDTDLQVLSEDRAGQRLYYIEIFCQNLRKVIDYTKEIAYGLHELAKNIVEHTDRGYGVISARIYDLERITSLKEIDTEWIRKFGSGHRFLDINVIDSGTVGIKKKYRENLSLELSQFEQELPEGKLRWEILAGYTADYNVTKDYGLHQFYYFNEVKLYHQINRMKAKLGLLIFSQTILNAKNAFVNLSSNDLESGQPGGYYMFSKDNQVRAYRSDSCYRLGTNYNFIIPVTERLSYTPIEELYPETQTSTSASVFLELHHIYDGKISTLKKIAFPPAGVSQDKYRKLDALKLQVVATDKITIPLIDSAELLKYLENSSDWVRFLANLQFGSDSRNDLVITNLSSETYTEIINILKIFDQADPKKPGFWRENRFILCFVPILYNRQTFWFNSVIGGKQYGQFHQLNKEIGRYHLNLSRITTEPANISKYEPLVIKSRLFSTSKRLLNFELLIRDDKNLSYFEQTMESLMNLPLNNQTDEY